MWLKLEVPATAVAFMSSIRAGSPSWLYSFVDLAFLLLIALSQLDMNLLGTIDLGEIAVPRIVTPVAVPLAADATQRWQLSVHPPDAQAIGPFVLAKAGTEKVPSRIGAEALRAGLESLRLQRGGKPLLVPHETSLSRDLLTAVALLEERWPGARRATIAPHNVSSAEVLPAVSTGP